MTAAAATPQRSTARRLVVTRLTGAGRWWLLAVVVGYVLTFALSDYSLFQLSRVTTTAIVVGSLVVLTGLSGQISAGQGAAFGLGAYTTAILMERADWPWVPAVLAAVVVCFFAGLVLGVPALRLGPLHLALVTLTFAVLLPLVATRWESLTGGPFGLTLAPVRAPVVTGLSDAQFLYLVTFAAMMLSLGLAAWWSRGRTGRALAALRSNPVMARTQGVDTSRLSVTAVALATTMAGLGGALNALVLQSAIPDAYPALLSLALLTGAVVGGVRSWAGAVIGGAYVVYVPELASQVASSTSGGQWAQVINAAVLLAALYFAPNGLAGVGGNLFGRLRRTATAARGTDGAHPRGHRSTTQRTDKG
jgi:branched-chain amino acid transport system permease protein